MSSVASYDYPNDEDRPRSVAQLAKSYQQTNTLQISPPSYKTSSSLSNIEPPEQSSPHSVLSANNTNNMSATATAEDPPEQNLSTKFNMSTSNSHSRIRANIMSTSSIHNISRNAKGHVYLNGEDSSVDDVTSSCGADETFGKRENKSVKIANEAHKIEPYGNNNHQQRDIMLGRNGRKLNPSSAIVLDKHLSGQVSSSSSSPTTKQKLSKKEQRERNSIALAKQFNYNNNNNSPSPGQSTYEYKEKLKDDDDSHVNYGYKVEDTSTQSNNKSVVANRVKFADKYGGQISKTRSWDEQGEYSSSNQGSRLGSNSTSTTQTKGAWRGNTQSSCDASVGSTETRRSNVVVPSPTSISKPTVQYVTSSLSTTSRYTKSNFPPSYFRGVRTKKLPTFHTNNNKSSSWLCGSWGGHQQHGYLKKNAAILIVLVCIVCITTLSYFGLGGSSGNEGIESQLNHIETTGYATSSGSIRGLTDGYNHQQQQQLPMTAGYAQEMGYSTDGQEQQSTKGIMDGVHPLPLGNINNNGVIDWSTGQSTTGVGGQQVVDWSKVPPHLRGYYSKMVNVNAAQQSEQEQVMSLEEQIDQGTTLLGDNIDTSNVETVNVDNIGEVAVPVIDMEEFTKQQEVLEFNAGVAGIQEPPPPTVDDQSSSLPVNDSLPDESLQGIDIQEDTSISDESNILDQVENTDEGSIIEGGQEDQEEPEYGMTMEEHEQMEQRIQQEEAEKLAIERLELQRGGGDQLSGGQVVEILPTTTVPGKDEQQQELLEQQSLELQGDAYNNQEALLTSINEEELAKQKQAEEDALLKAATIEEDQRASREQNPPELDAVTESEEQVVMNVSEEEAPAESLSPQEEVDQLENVQDQEETGQVPPIDNEVQAEDESLNEQQQLDNESQVNQQENNDEEEILIKKKKGKKKQKELEKLLKKEKKFQQRKQERIEQLKKDRREAKKRKKQNQEDDSNDNEIREDGATTIDQLQKELNELAALLSQKT